MRLVRDSMTEIVQKRSGAFHTATFEITDRDEKKLERMVEVLKYQCGIEVGALSGAVDWCADWELEEDGYHTTFVVQAYRDLIAEEIASFKRTYAQAKRDIKSINEMKSRLGVDSSCA